MMGSCHGNDLLRSRHSAWIVRFSETSQEGFEMFSKRWNVPADLHRPSAEDAGLYAKPLTGVRILHPQ